MSFQVHDKDLLGRNGTITTKSGAFETPYMFPVLDANIPIGNHQLLEKAGVSAVMTNAYLLRRNMQGKDPIDVHEVLGFDKIVATDSGAYQILEYGKVGVEPREIVEYQEKINSDIAVILDVPTGFRGGPGHARWTVDETLRRADEALRVVKRKDILWVGPVQGGSDLDEVDRCARSMSKRDFSIYALGSPTELMEGQHYETLVDMIIAAKKSLPIEKPFHLFGAGHPAIFPFLVALGCDLFDSAAYALYARAGRYMTPDGTLLIEEMTEFYCTCPMCYGHKPAEIMDQNASVREQFLIDHNLIACFAELRRIKETIRKGRLWNLLESRAHAHPALRKCFRQVSKYVSSIEKYDPLVKRHGIFWYGSSLSSEQPAVLSYDSRLTRYPTSGAFQMLLLPGRWRRPFHQDPRYEQVSSAFQNQSQIHICFYSLAYGPVPLEWDEAFPIPQTESYDPGDPKLYDSKARLVADFVEACSPKKLVVVSDGVFGKILERKIARVISSRKIVVFPGDETPPIELVREIRKVFRKVS